VRLTAALWMMPMFGDARVAMPVRILFSFLLSLLLAPMMPPMPAIDPFSLAALGVAFEQILFGVLLALCLQLLFMAMSLMGQILSIQMGLAMASMNDPVHGDSVPLVSELFLFLCILLFLGLNGHLVVLDVLVESFRSWPPGHSLFALDIGVVLRLFGWALGAALLLSLPAVVAMLLVNLTFGVMSRSAPALNVFSLGFPLALTLGLFAILLTLGGVASRYMEFAAYALEQMRVLAG
jgi:flagellar biosynthetic protein FliR